MDDDKLTVIRVRKHRDHGTLTFFRFFWRRELVFSLSVPDEYAGAFEEAFPQFKP